MATVGSTASGAKASAMKTGVVHAPADGGAQAPAEAKHTPHACAVAAMGVETDDSPRTIMDHKRAVAEQNPQDLLLADRRVLLDVVTGKRKSVDLSPVAQSKMPPQKSARLSNSGVQRCVDDTIRQHLQDAADFDARAAASRERAAAADRERDPGVWESPPQSPRVIPPRVETLRESTRDQAHARNAALVEAKSAMEEGELAGVDEDGFPLVDYEESELGDGAAGDAAEPDVASAMDVDEEKPAKPVVEIHNCDVADEARQEELEAAEELALKRAVCRATPPYHDRHAPPTTADVARELGAKARAAGASAKMADVPNVSSLVASVDTTPRDQPIDRRGGLNRTFAEDLEAVMGTFGDSDPPTAIARVGRHPLLMVYETTVEELAALRARGVPEPRRPGATKNDIPIAYDRRRETLYDYVMEFWGWSEHTNRTRRRASRQITDWDAGVVRSKLCEFARQRVVKWNEYNPPPTHSLGARAGGSQRPTTAREGQSSRTSGASQGRLPSAAPPAPTNRAGGNSSSTARGTPSVGPASAAAGGGPLPRTGVADCGAPRDAYSQTEGTAPDRAWPTRCFYEQSGGQPCPACVRHWRHRTEKTFRSVDERVTRHKKEHAKELAKRVDPLDAAIVAAGEERELLRLENARLSRSLDAESVRHSAALQEARDRCLRLEGQLEALQRLVERLQLRPAMAQTQMMHVTGQSQALASPSALSTSASQESGSAAQQMP